MERKPFAPIIVFLVVLVAVVAIAWPKGKWFVFSMDVNEKMAKWNSYPPVEDVLKLPDELKDLAVQKRGYDRSKVDVKMRLAAEGAPPITKWHLYISIEYPGRDPITDVRWIKGGVSPEYLTTLEEKGIPVTRPPEK